MTNISDVVGGIGHHSRRVAIHLGDLVDVTTVASEAGIRLSTALTRAVYEDCVAWDDQDNQRKGTVQDPDGRLWDVLWMTRQAIRSHPRPGARVPVRLVRTPRPGRVRAAQRVELIAVCGSGDHGELVITIMQPGEG